MVVVPAHVSLAASLTAIDCQQLTGVVVCPCCNWHLQQSELHGVPPDAAAPDMAILSPHRMVRVWGAATCAVATTALATAAAKAGHAHHFITKLPRGYETQVDDETSRLDLGQRYRIGLARALMRDPALLVIEEPAEPLDDDTKSLLGDTYDRIVSGRTVMFLPTRLSTVRRADRVVVLHDGQVAETGRHEELVQSSELYRHWEYTRFNAFGRVSVPAEE